MNEETMRKHYETTPKDILINILISARKEFDKLQNRNKECKQEIERLNNIIKEVREYIVTHKLYCFKYDNEELFEIVTDKKAKDKLLEILDKVD